MSKKAENTPSRLEILKSANRYLSKLIDHELTRRLFKIKKERNIPEEERRNSKNIIYKDLNDGQDFVMWLKIQKYVPKGTIIFAEDKNENIQHGILLDVGVVKAWDAGQSMFLFYEGVHSWVCSIKETFCDEWNVLDSVIIPFFSASNGESTVLSDLPCFILGEGEERNSGENSTNFSGYALTSGDDLYITPKRMDEEEKEIPSLFRNTSRTNLMITGKEERPPYMTSPSHGIEMSIFDQINQERYEKERSFHENLGRVYMGAIEEAKEELEKNKKRKGNQTRKRRVDRAYEKSVKKLKNSVVGIQSKK